MRFTDKEIEVFREVMATESISGAGSRLRLSQPSVSRIIGSFEKKFGCKLFSRQARGVKPTPEARAFLEEVERKLVVMTTLEEAASQIANKSRGMLLVGVNAGLSVSIIPSALKTFNVHEKRISVRLQIKSSPRIIDYVRSGTLDLGLVNIQDIPEGVSLLAQGVVPYMAIFPQHHPIAQNSRSIKLEDLHAEHIVGIDEDVADALSVRRIGQNFDFPITAGVSFAAVVAAEAICAIPIVDAFMASYWTSRVGGVAVPITDVPKFKFALIEPSAVRSSLVSEGFSKHIKGETNRIKEWATK